MDPIPVVSPGRVGFVADRLQRAYDLLQGEAESGRVPGSALCVGRRGAMSAPRFFGLPDEVLFLVASITKPVVAAAVVLLVERGQLGLHDRVVEYLPEFGQNGKEDVRIRHLLTHTSGLPDMLPENTDLRAAHAGLPAFLEGTCRHGLMFAPGSRVSYQSMGFTVLGELVQRIAGTALPEFLRREFFEPLGMHDTWLGAPAEVQHRIAPVVLPPEQQGTDWNWNTAYWRGLGAPWGGLITSPADFARYCRMMLDEGTLGRTRVLGPASVRAMTTNQLATLPDIAEEDRRSRPWGLGWRLVGAGHTPSHGDLLGPNAYGHSGATGTLCWIDPDADAFCTLFTTRPEGDAPHLAHVSNIVAGSLA
jgi:CubicO group peptidase (beta-lactamase class C family)